MATTSAYRTIGLDPAIPDEADRALAAGIAIQASRPGAVIDDMAALLDDVDPDGLLMHGRRARLLVVEGTAGDVGRCLAIAPAVPPAAGGSATGTIGLWECIDDDAAAAELLVAAGNWLRDAGCTELVGPTDTLWGARSGFAATDAVANMLSPRASGGAEAWAQHGTRPRSVTRAFELRTVRGDQVSDIDGYMLRTLRASHLDHAVADMRALLRQRDPDGAGAWPSPADALATSVLRMERLLDDRLVIMAISHTGRLAGFAFGSHDHSELMRSMDGDWSRLVDVRRIRGSRTALVHTLAVRAGEGEFALTQLLVDAMQRNARLCGCSHVHWMGVAENSALESVLRADQARPIGEWSLHRRTLAEPVSTDPASLVRDVALRLEDQLAR